MRKSKQKIDVLDDLDEALENSEKLPVQPGPKRVCNPIVTLPFLIIQNTPI